MEELEEENMCEKMKEGNLIDSKKRTEQEFRNKSILPQWISSQKHCSKQKFSRKIQERKLSQITSYKIKMVNFSDQNMLRVLWLVTALSWGPLMIADLVMVYQYANSCASVVAQNLNLLTWMYNDGYIKMAVIFTGVFFIIVARELPSQRKMFAVCWSTLICMYCLFELGWILTGSVMFWGTVWPLYSFYCRNAFGYYTWVLLILSYILIPLNFGAAIVLRPKRQEEHQSPYQRV